MKGLKTKHEGLTKYSDQSRGRVTCLGDDIEVHEI